MKTKILVAVAAIVAFAIAGSLSPVKGEPQQEVPKKGRIQPTTQLPSETEFQGDKMGRMDDENTMENMSIIMQVDSMMQRMTVLMERTQAYSKSFGLLAAAHHGADKKEIQMMQRMSDSMGTMAGEIKMSLQQYKDTLENETTSESGSMRSEVQDFGGVFYGMATYIEQAVNTLQTLEEQLGQG